VNQLKNLKVWEKQIFFYFTQMYAKNVRFVREGGTASFTDVKKSDTASNRDNI